MNVSDQISQLFIPLPLLQDAVVCFRDSIKMKKREVSIMRLSIPLLQDSLKKWVITTINTNSNNTTNIIIQTKDTLATNKILLTMGIDFMKKKNKFNLLPILKPPLILTLIISMLTTVTTVLSQMDQRSNMQARAMVMAIIVQKAVVLLGRWVLELQGFNPPTSNLQDCLIFKTAQKFNLVHKTALFAAPTYLYCTCIPARNSQSLVLLLYRNSYCTKINGLSSFRHFLCAHESLDQC